MFTGLVSDVGQVRQVEKRGDTHLVIATHYNVAAMDVGASVACAGICLTVVDKGTAKEALDALVVDWKKTFKEDGKLK